MPASQADISKWFDRGIRQGATHLIVRCDPFDYRGEVGDACCYPVFVEEGESALEKADEGSDRLMEVYDLRMDKDEQINTSKRVYNF